MLHSPVIFPYLQTLVSWITYILSGNSKEPYTIKFFYLVPHSPAARSARLRACVPSAFVCSPLIQNQARKEFLKQHACLYLKPLV
jgi:hypothetical protein